MVIWFPRARNEDMSCGTLVRSCRLAMDILCLTCWSTASRWLPEVGQSIGIGVYEDLAVRAIGGEGAYTGCCPVH
jgi:hypothetical protein